MKPGIGLLAECEYEFEYSKGNPIKLSQYALPNDQYKNLINEKTINEKYETSNRGKYNMNLVDSSVLEVSSISNGIEDDNAIESASMKQISNSIIAKRSQNESNDYGKLTEDEVEFMKQYSNFIMKEELNNEGQGVIHISNDNNNESIQKYNGIKESTEIHNSLKDAQNHQNGCMGDKSKAKCLKSTKISKTHDVEGSLSKVLDIAKKYDKSNTIKINEGEKVDLSKPENLSKDSESIVDVLKTSLDIYKQAVAISKMSKEEYIIHLFEVIIGLIERYKESSYLYHPSIRDLNEGSFKDMTTILSDAVSTHDKNSNNEEKLGKVTKMLDFKSSAETNSKYVNDKLHEIFDNILDILNDNDMDISNIGLVDNMDINNKRFNDDRTYEINYLYDELNQLRITGSKTTRQEYKEKLLNIYDKVTEIEQIFDRENHNKNTFVNNSQMVYTLKESLINVLKNNDYLEDKDVQARLKTYKSTISGVKKSEVKSSNVLNIDHILSQVKMDDYILKNSKSTMYVKRYFDGLKDGLFYDDSIDETIDKLGNIEKEINEKIEQFNSYRKPDGHYEEANHLVELINNYNELVATALSLDIDVGDSNYIYISNDIELSERLNHIRVKGFNRYWVRIRSTLVVFKG